MKYRFGTGHNPQAAHRSVRLGVLGALVAFALGACSEAPPVFSAVTGQTEVIVLPELTAAQNLRDSVARIDFAVALRAEEMAGMATQCDSCRLILEQTSDSAQIRSAQSGGVWEPWGDFESEESASSVVELRPEVGVAPYQVGPLAAYMWVSATAQLDEVAVVEGLSAAERQGLSSILAGRLGSAKLLARHYGVDLDAQVAALPPGATQAFAVDTPVSQSPQSGGEAAEESVSYASETLVAYDCVRSSVLMMPDATLAPLVPFELAQTLNERAKMLVSVGTVDTRSVRCVLQDLTLDEVLAEILVADLTLAGADTQEVRLAAASYTVTDVGVWANVSVSTLPTTSVLPLGDENGPQS